MITFRDIKFMNDATKAYLESKNQSAERNNIIQYILDDEACFFKMDKQDALDILKDIGVSQSKLEVIYSELTTKEEFEKLINDGKLDKNDKELKIKFE